MIAVISVSSQLRLCVCACFFLQNSAICITSHCGSAAVAAVALRSQTDSALFMRLVVHSSIFIAGNQAIGWSLLFGIRYVPYQNVYVLMLVNILWQLFGSVVVHCYVLSCECKYSSNEDTTKQVGVSWKRPLNLSSLYCLLFTCRITTLKELWKHILACF